MYLGRHLRPRTTGFSERMSFFESSIFQANFASISIFLDYLYGELLDIYEKIKIALEILIFVGKKTMKTRHENHCICHTQCYNNRIHNNSDDHLT